MLNMLYKRVLKPTLFMIDPEWVHEKFIIVGELMGSNRFTRSIVSSVYGYKPDAKLNVGMGTERIVDGIKYKTPFILAAGFDYNGRLTNILDCIGLGGEEVGSVTAKPCKGNNKPRLRRLPASRSIIVNKGLKNDGVDAVIERLKKKDESNFVVGVSIARTNDVSCVDVESGIEDYVYSFRRLNEENVGHYYTINISCPNSFGGESFTDPAHLERLMVALEAITCNKPVYVKMPISVDWQKFSSILDVLARHRVNGVVIGNLQKDYSVVAGDSMVPRAYSGGLSGEPCREASNDLIRKTRFNYGKRFTIIGCGGVMSPEQAKEKFDAGADLIQLITGIIYEGPGLIRKMCKGL